MRTLCLRSFIIAIAFLETLSLPAFARGIDSGGGDNLPVDAGSAWFLGDRPVHYCLEIAPHYGIDRVTLQALVEKSVGIWREYIATRAVYADRPAGQRLDLNYVARSRCEGDEDLRFLFGIETKAVKKAKRSLFDPGYLFVRESYDRQAGWGKGIVWFAPPAQISPFAAQLWREKALTYGLLHELGHVLGCGHIEGTIMADDVAQYPPVEPKIDDSRLLIIPATYQASRTYATDPTPSGDDLSARIFERFTGVKPHGPVQVDVNFHGWTAPTTADVVLTADGVVARLAFKAMAPSGAFMPSSASITDRPEIFKIAVGDIVRREGMSGVVSFGTIQDPFGVTLIAGLEFNMNFTHGSLADDVRGPLGLFFLENSRRFSIYR